MSVMDHIRLDDHRGSAQCLIALFLRTIPVGDIKQLFAGVAVKTAAFSLNNSMILCKITSNKD